MKKKRQSLHWVGKKNIQLKETNVPKLKNGEILLKVESCAICGSDVKIFFHGNKRVNPGQIIGHEIAGTVIETKGKNLHKFKVGDRLAVGADVPCGKKICKYCNSEQANCCDKNYAIGHQFEGGFTDYMILNKLTLNFGPVVKFKKNISFDEAAIAEPLACCINGFETVNYNKKKEVILILGAGPIGFLLASLGKYYNKNSKIILADYTVTRLNFAKKKIKNLITINLKKEELIKKILQITNNNLCDYIFTANNSIRSQIDAIKVVAKKGVINFFGGLPHNSKDTLKIDSNIIHYKEAIITGSHGSTPSQHKKAIELISKKKINVKPLITHIYSLKNIKLGYKKAISGNAMKVVIKPHV
jgi:L-iditol 2-dehydrogenase